MKILSVQEMIEAEKAADAQGHSYATMMELAGTAFAKILLNRVEGRKHRFLVLIGPGNNGGDGLVVARILREKSAFVTAFLTKPRDSKKDINYKKAIQAGVEILEPDGKLLSPAFEGRLASYDIIIDSLFGIGLSRPIDGIYQIILETVRHAVDNDRSKFVAAVDCSSGINCDTGEISDTTLKADLTVTFGATKIGHILHPAKNYVGELVVADIGIDPVLIAKAKTEIATEEVMRHLVPNRPESGHKGTFGKVVIAGGSISYKGAPFLSGLGAFRAGSGLVNMLVPTAVRNSMSGLLMEATFSPIADDDQLGQTAGKWVDSYLTDYDAILVGPGLSRSDHFVHTCLNKLKRQPKPAVFDADALNAISRRNFLLDELPPNSVLTPHPGEMARLLGIFPRNMVKLDRIELVREKAKSWRCILLLKGANTVIGAPDGRVVVLPFANPLLSVAGSGDVLGGIIVSLLGQGLEPFDAAVLGGWLHGAAGELGGEKYGDRGMLASEIAGLIPIVIKKLLEN